VTGQPGESGASTATFAERLDKLFKTIRKKDGNEYSLREVADAIVKTGEPISFAYIGQLRTGVKVDPRLSHLRALARFFGVPVEYLTSTDDRLVAAVDSELGLVAALQQLRVRTVALRQAVLPEAEAGIAAVAEVLDRIRALEQGRTEDRPTGTHEQQSRTTPQGER
jgi:transcriptional regulator with XRE-family HTH domain